MWPVDRDKMSLWRKYSQKSVINISTQKGKDDPKEWSHVKSMVMIMVRRGLASCRLALSAQHKHFF